MNSGEEKARLAEVWISPPDMYKKNSYYETLKDALEHPELYKVCSVCGCVLRSNEEDCAYCSGYRFNTEAEVVSNTALDQLAHPFERVINPVSSAYD